MDPAKDAIWSVLLLNDDVTPMDFVVDVNEQVFDIDLENARRLMLRVHREGSAEFGAYSQEIATAKANQVWTLRANIGIRCNVLSNASLKARERSF